MSVQESSYYWLTCDGRGRVNGTLCGEKSTEGGEFSAWGDVGTAIDDAVSSEWVQHDGKDYCREHSMQFRCDDCGEVKDECVCEADLADVAEVAK